MNVDRTVMLAPSISTMCWASPGQPGQTLDDLISKMNEVGNNIIVTDTLNNRLLIATSNEPGEPVWACRECWKDGEGEVFIVTSESELMAHWEETHA